MATAQTSIDEVESREADALTHLEERIQKTVALVTRLRAEKDAAEKELADAQSDLAAAKVELSESQQTTARLSAELGTLRTEKLEVRGRLEKLLSHIDQLGAV